MEHGLVEEQHVQRDCARENVIASARGDCACLRSGPDTQLPIATLGTRKYGLQHKLPIQQISAKSFRRANPGCSLLS